MDKNHNTYLSVFACCVFLLGKSLCSAQTPMQLIPNGDFEKGLESWKISEKTEMSRIVGKPANGKASLHIKDDDQKQGSSVTSAEIAVKPGLYVIKGQVQFISGDGIGMYLQLLDADKKEIESRHFPLNGEKGKWEEFEQRSFLTEESKFLRIWFHSYSTAKVELYIDDVAVTNLGNVEMKPPFSGQYKIRPSEKEKLTAADVVGPDGIVYPDWRYAGVQGGIPDVPVKAKLADYQAVPDDGKDDSIALQQAVDAVGKLGGGAVLLDAGTYHLDRPVFVQHDGVVIRGLGWEKTKLIFRYDVPENGVGFYGLIAGQKIGRNSRIELHCRPKDLVKMQLFANDKLVQEWHPSRHSGNTFSISIGGDKLLSKTNSGLCRLRGVATWGNGNSQSTKIEMDADGQYQDLAPVLPPYSVITFLGEGPKGKKHLLSENGKRGDIKIDLKSPDGLEVGDFIIIDGPATKRWKKLTGNKCRWGYYRRNILKITKIEGNTIHLNQPLRIEFPIIDGSYVQKILLRQRCGLENLYLEQAADLWITSSYFYNAANCWAKGVKIKKCGRFPVYGQNAKWCEIRDSVFDDAWFKGGGGTAYAGWEKSYDCLTENLETFKLRHGPQFQWSASGNVMRKSVFHDSDGQWHSGWTNENLMEQCFIDSKRGNGGYGYGLWASPPEDTAHGPNGPRNVVYNCRITSERDGLWMGGMNENWLILYNCFDVQLGRGVFAKDSSFDHIIKGNTFIIRDGKSTAIMLMTGDCIGVEILGNRIFGGNGKLLMGQANAKTEGNLFFPLLSDPGQLDPEVPSIFEWQRKLKE